MNAANLEYFANNIKNSNKKYSIKGYADSTTGKKKVNEKLASKRAQNVYNLLVEKYGINKDLLSIDSQVIDHTKYQVDSTEFVVKKDGLYGVSHIILPSQI
jgi:hypothetical protein